MHKHLLHSNITYTVTATTVFDKTTSLALMLTVTELTDDLKKPIEARIAIGRASLKNYRIT